MTLITTNDQIKSFLKKLKHYNPKKEVYSLNESNIKEKTKFFKELKTRSITPQKCVNCGKLFIMGDDFLNLHCKYSKNMLHVGDTFGKIEYRTFVAITTKLQSIPPAILVKKILIEYDGFYLVNKNKSVDIYKSKIFIRKNYH